jgi:diguanylate cyclase (GGDEF)-like protein
LIFNKKISLKFSKICFIFKENSKSFHFTGKIFMSDTAVTSLLPRILVVDDEPNFQKLIQTQLARKHFEVLSCKEPDQAVQLIEEKIPNLVLMDLMMPKLNGFTLIKEIRGLMLKSYLPIIVVTARQASEDIVEALDAGADDYIMKPFKFEELFARINNMLRIKNLQDSIQAKSDELNEANLQINHLNRNLTNTNRELKKRVYDLHNIFEISFKVMGQTEVDSLVNTALLNALGIFTSKSAMLLLLDPDDPETYRVKDSRGFFSPNIDQFSISREDKIIKYLEFVSKPIQIKDVLYEFESIKTILEELEIKIMAPMFQEEEVLGIFCLGPNVSGQEYPIDVMEIMGIMTNMLSVALQNARNFEQIKALSYTDEMTGLHNYRFFTMRLKEELARARRNNASLSLLILDVDFFKNYNDTLGHPAGDEILRQLSVILKSSIRDNDIVARYGGEEFAVILPSTDENGAVILAERIREKVEDFKFPKQNIQPQGNLTISIGIAIFPDNAINLDDIIVAADRALYFAKESGRNKVVAFGKIKR